ncbi:MAG: sugar phosphate isomerase/epimerase [Armatimonadota bacterium]|nr:MAG: sugar phosphate isomerase/epimerase [Armatimonadota bacterium]
MSEGKVTFSVFTKPWKMPLAELGRFVKSLGFDAIELPVRPGYQVLPENVGRDLPAAATELADCGVTIASVAGPIDEPTIAACGEAGVATIRICVGVGDEGYMAGEARLQREFDALIPVLDEHGVRIGIQNHQGRNDVCNAMGVRHLIEQYDPKHVGAVWDVGHNGLCGEEPNAAVDILWAHLCMVNFKNALWQRTNGPEAEWAEWRPYWTSGRHGLASWPRAASELSGRGYSGVVCLTAEYNDHDAVNRLIADDIAFAKSLFAQVVTNE